MRTPSFSHYAALSLLAFVAMISYVTLEAEDFYDMLTTIATSKSSLAVIHNFALMLLLAAARFSITFFFGRLRSLELEELTEAGRGFLMDTILFLILSTPTIDAVEVSTMTLLKYILFVVALKTFHLIAQIRVAHLFEVGAPRRDVMLRLFGFMVLLLGADLFIFFNFWRASSKQSTFYLWVTFECVGLLCLGIINLLKHSVHCVDLYLVNGLRQKMTFMFYLDLFQDLSTVLTYLIFLILFLIYNPNRLPIYMLADMLNVSRTLFLRIRSFQRYLLLTRYMDERFKDASPEALSIGDRCIICRDVLTPGAKQLPCGHIFHNNCVKSWFIQQQSCPTCRADIPLSNIEISPVIPPDENVICESPRREITPPTDVQNSRTILTNNGMSSNSLDAANVSLRQRRRRVRIRDTSATTKAAEFSADGGNFGGCNELSGVLFRLNYVHAPCAHSACNMNSSAAQQQTSLNDYRTNAKRDATPDHPPSNERLFRNIHSAYLMCEYFRLQSLQYLHDIMQHVSNKTFPEMENYEERV